MNTESNKLKPSIGFISRAFRGRRQQSDVAGRLPPGQYLERGFPVLSAVAATPHTPLERWDFLIEGHVKKPKRWTRQELLAFPHETPTVDISCVTKWDQVRYPLGRRLRRDLAATGGL